jgi:hypothetical protein
MLCGLADARKRDQIRHGGCDGRACGFCAFWKTQSAAENCGEAAKSWSQGAAAAGLGNAMASTDMASAAIARRAPRLRWGTGRPVSRRRS